MTTNDEKAQEMADAFKPLADAAERLGKAIVDDGGPAFPSEQGHIPDGTWNQTYDPGMSLIDYFAAKVMQGMAEQAYKSADAMLEARQNRGAK